MTRRLTPVIVVLSAWALAAEPLPPQKALAESLFSEGRKLLQAGQYADACAKFAASYDIDRALGTLLNLSDCRERLGLLVEAYAGYREAGAWAERTGQLERVRVARERVERLQPQLVLLELQVDAPVEGLLVTLNGAAVDLGDRLPKVLRAGPVALVASAPGFQSFTVSTEAVAGSRLVQRIPALTRAPAPETVTPAAAIASPPAVVLPAPAPVSVRPLRVVSWVLLGLGVAGLGLATGLTIDAGTTWSQARTDCVGAVCGERGFPLAQRARASAQAATVSTIAGGSVAALGALLWFLSRDRAPVSVVPHLSPTFAGALVRLEL